jgi:iron complex outermembrane receptor protein
MSRRCISPALLAAVAAMSPLASAQGGADAGSEGLAEIVVTAQRRAESVQDTPLAITALSGDSIEQFARDDVAGLAFQSPSLAYSEAGGEAQLYVRGVGTNIFGVGADPSVAINLDGVYLGRPNMGLTQFLDVERVELLRGPQGILYGRNATGGAVNIVSRMPTESLEGYATLGFGSFNRREMKAAISGPISDEWSARIALRGMTDDGYTNDIDPRGSNELDDNDLKALRGVLRWQRDGVSATLIGEYSEYEGGNTSIRPIDNLGLAQSAGGLTPVDFRTVRNNTPSFNDWQTGGITATLDWQINDNVNMAWITAHRAWDSDFLFNTDGTEIEITRTTFIYDTKQWSSELRFSGEQGAVKWIAGGYWIDEDKFGALGLVRANQTFPGGPTPILDPAFAPRSFIFLADGGTHAEALFAQFDWQFAPAWTASVGGRYSQETKTDFYRFSVLLPDTELLGVFSPRPIPAATGANVKNQRVRFDAFTPKFSLQWRPSDDALYYASYTKGFKSGGFNNLQTPANNVPYNPEFIKSFEVGAKTEWLDNRLRVNATAFHYDYTDLQVTAFQSGLTITTNAADATVQGIELEVEAQPADGFNVGVSIALLDATYDEFQAVYGTCRPTNAALDPVNCTNPAVTAPRRINAAGNTLNNAPEFKGSAYAAYSFALAGGELALSGQVAHQGRVFFNNPANDLVSSQGDVTLLDARVAWTNGNGAIEVAAFGKNLSDEEYFHNIVQFTSTSDSRLDIFGIGNALGYAAPGRQWGVEFSYRFGK